MWEVGNRQPHLILYARDAPEAVFTVYLFSQGTYYFLTALRYVHELETQAAVVMSTNDTSFTLCPIFSPEKALAAIKTGGLTGLNTAGWFWGKYIKNKKNKGISIS